MLAAGKGKFEEGAGGLNQAIGTAGQEIDLTAPATHPCPNTR
jgi:hypothetical protein